MAKKKTAKKATKKKSAKRVANGKRLMKQMRRDPKTGYIIGKKRKAKKKTAKRKTTKKKTAKRKTTKKKTAKRKTTKAASSKARPRKNGRVARTKHGFQVRHSTTDKVLKTFRGAGSKARAEDYARGKKPKKNPGGAGGTLYKDKKKMARKNPKTEWWQAMLLPLAGGGLGYGGTFLARNGVKFLQAQFPTDAPAWLRGNAFGGGVEITLGMLTGLVSNYLPDEVRPYGQATAIGMSAHGTSRMVSGFAPGTMADLSGPRRNPMDNYDYSRTMRRRGGVGAKAPIQRRSRAGAMGARAPMKRGGGGVAAKAITSRTGSSPMGRSPLGNVGSRAFESNVVRPFS